MAAYGKKASEKVEAAMRERNEGTLKSGGSGKPVTSRKQAIAIGLSEARREGGKVPAKSADERSGAAGKATPKKRVVKKTVPKKAAAKKTVPKKAVAKKAARKPSAKRVGPR